MMKLLEHHTGNNNSYIKQYRRYKYALAMFFIGKLLVFSYAAGAYF